MQRMKLTCPFTGVEFEGFKETSLGKFFYANPLNHEMTSVKYDSATNSITINLEDFAHVETVTPDEATDILMISRQRMSQIVNENVIPAHIVAGKPVLKLSQVLDYKENRKPGRPRKAE